jgi:proline iminopeptidase
VIFGGSWGVTLGLAYTEQHPERVTAAVFASVTMTRPQKCIGSTKRLAGSSRKSGTGFGAVFPRTGAMATWSLRTTVCSTRKQMCGYGSAAQDWCDWEAAVMSLEPGYS